MDPFDGLPVVVLVLLSLTLSLLCYLPQSINAT